MSARLSNSPNLHLRVGKSRLRDLLYGALCFSTVCALTALYSRGYALAALLLIPMASGLLWRLRHDAMAGAELCYQQGVWDLQQSGVRRRISLSKRSTSTSGVIYLAFVEQPSGRTGAIWLFRDSSSAEQLRRLRVRLALLH
ncbi:Uncharacterised protein [Halioglobus japonicus]|nr:Uncharacterised protein [Halioglobus japonicus]